MVERGMGAPATVTCSVGYADTVRFRACVPRNMATDLSGFRASPLCRHKDESYIGVSIQD